jgi:lipopolysaccharide assembly outer membrane protein LptD (OstA)
MPGWIRICLLSVGLLLVLGLLLAVIWVPTDVPLGAGAGVDMLRLDDAVISGVSAGNEKWQIRAEQVHVTKDRSPMRLQKLRDGALTVDGKPLLGLTADEADYNRATRQLSLVGDVRVTYRERVRVEAPGLVWDARGNRLRAGGVVTVRVRGVVAQGRNLDLDLKKGTLTMSQVTAQVPPSAVEQTSRPAVFFSFRRLAVAGCAVLSMAAALGQDASRDSTTPPGPGAAKEKPIDISGDHLRYTDETSEWRYWGHVVAIQDDTWFLCDEILYNDETKQGSCRGSIKITDPKLDLTGDDVTFDTATKMAVITGSVKAVYHRTEEKATDESQPNTKEGGSLREKVKGDVVMTCDRLEYNYKDKIAVMTGGTHIETETWIATADRVTYARKSEIAELVGHVHAVHKEKGHAFDAPRVRMSLKKGDEWIEADSEDKTPIRATVMVEEEEGESKTGSPTNPSGGEH